MFIIMVVIALSAIPRAVRFMVITPGFQWADQETAHPLPVCDHKVDDEGRTDNPRSLK
jgi:hypothetical protein